MFFPTFFYISTADFYALFAALQQPPEGGGELFFVNVPGHSVLSLLEAVHSFGRFYLTLGEQEEVCHNVVNHRRMSANGGDELLAGHLLVI